MDRFEQLVEAIKKYDNQFSGFKGTSHHSAVSVRVKEMEAALSKENESKLTAGDALE